MTLLDDAEEACGMGYSYDIPASISNKALMDILVIQIWRPKEFLLRVEDVLVRTSDDGLGNTIFHRKFHLSCFADLSQQRFMTQDITGSLASVQPESVRTFTSISKN